MAELIDPDLLQTPANFALTYKAGGPAHRSYIYKLIDQNKLPTKVIDGVVFIDLSKLPPTPPDTPAESRH